MKSKVCTAEQAVEIIKDGDVLIPSCFIRSLAAEELIYALEDRYRNTGCPKNLTLIHAATAGEVYAGTNLGLDRLAQDGLLARVFSGFYGYNDKIKAMIKEGKVEAYNFPLGIISQLMRSYSRGHNGELSKIGIGTYIDPRIEGGKWNKDVPSTGEWIRLVDLFGEEFLYYTTPKPTFAILRGTTADEYGNISMENEAFYSLTKVAAMAVKQNGGTVVFQVKNLVKGGTIDAQSVVIPGIFVDKIVVCTDPENLHRQTSGAFYNPIYSGHLKSTAREVETMPLNVVKIMSRRCAMELSPGDVVNLGTGNPEFVGKVATEEGCQDLLTLTVETGAIGGSPLSKSDFGATANAWGFMDEDRIFDLYQGGGLNIAFLGLAEVDASGDVNVSKFKGTIMGCGGFIEITQPTPKLVFMGSFTAGGLEAACADGKLCIHREGKHVKFKKNVEQITFSGKYAIETGQDVTFITERAVFKLTKDGLKLVEIAPGVDLQKDILAHMEFTPIMDDIKLMDSRIFFEEPIGLKSIIEAKAASNSYTDN